MAQRSSQTTFAYCGCGKKSTLHIWLMYAGHGEEAFDGLKIRAPCHAFDEIDFESLFFMCGGGLSFRGYLWVDMNGRPVGTMMSQP